MDLASSQKSLWDLNVYLLVSCVFGYGIYNFGSEFSLENSGSIINIF